MSTIIVVTTISAPTPAVLRLASCAIRRSAPVVVIGDTKTPEPYVAKGIRYFSLTEQRRLGFRLAGLAPTGHYVRKNIGYLIAVREGATQILETDDDNFPKASFGAPRNRVVYVPVLRTKGPVNIYSYFTQAHVWPRSLPLTAIRTKSRAYSRLPRQRLDCPIQNGLADLDPDVDAIYRLTLGQTVKFKTGRSVALAPGAWCPFNSQNTCWWPAAYPLLYLPATCTPRMADIWRGYIAQRICWQAGWNLLFHSPTVFQKRNPHDLLRDFADELPGYLHSQEFISVLSDLRLRKGEATIVDNLIRCYDALISAKHLDKREMTYLNAWIHDLRSI